MKLTYVCNYFKLHAEFAKIPASGGSVSHRRRRAVVELRLDEVDREISAVRMKLKSIHAM